MKVVLRTDRLLLREWVDEDLEPYARMNADPVVMEHFPAPLSRSESDASAARIRQMFVDRGFGFWALEIPSEIRFAGFVGLSVPAFDLPFACTSPCVEIGWRLATSTWGKGYATEAARAALAYGFDALGLDEIVSFTAVPNARSQRVMERIGMKRFEDEAFEHPGLPDGHRLRRHVLFRAKKRAA